MILHAPRKRPEPWQTQRDGLRHSWLVPLLAIEWVFEWIAFVLSRWSFLDVLEYLRTFGILVAVIFYFSESGDRLKQKHYQAWQVINTAQGKGGNGGRIDALQELNEDKVPLVGVDVSGAFLQGLRLEKGNLARATLSAADVRNAVLPSIDFGDADLRNANFRDSNCRAASFRNAALDEADFSGADLSGADFAGATLSNTDLRNANLLGIDWQHISSIKSANIAGVKNAPDGFVAWALKSGAVQ